MTRLALACSRNGAMPIRAMAAMISRRSDRFFRWSRIVPTPRMK